jgi:hypothetical protein
MRLASILLATLGVLPLVLFAANCRFLLAARAVRGEVVGVTPAEPGQSEWRYDVRVKIGDRTSIVQVVGPSAKQGRSRNTYRPVYGLGEGVDLLYEEGADPPARLASGAWIAQVVMLVLTGLMGAGAFVLWKVPRPPQRGPRPSLARRVLGDVLRLLGAIALLAFMVIVIFGVFALLMRLLPPA